MNFKRNIQIIGIASILTMPVQAETLTQVLRMALDSDPDYKEAVANRNSTILNEDIVNANYYPRLDFNYYNSQRKTGEYKSTDGNSGNTTTIPENDHDSSGYSFSITQSIYNRHNSVNSNMAEIGTTQADINLAIKKQSLIVKVAERYFDVLSAKDNLGFSEAEKKAVARQLEQTKQRFEVGLVAITDVHEAQAQYDQSVAQGISAKVRLASARESLRVLTGRYIDNLASLSKQSPLVSPSPDNIETWTSMAMKQNLSILSAQHSVEIQKLNVSSARADNYPSLDLGITHSISDDTQTTTIGTNSTTTTTPDTTSISLNLNYNIYNGGHGRSQTKKAQYELIAAKERLESAHRSTQNLVRNAFLNVTASISKVKAFQQAVISSESALKASEAGFEVGTRTTVDVLNARRKLFSAKNDRANARYDYLVSRLALKQAAGSLSQVDLQEIDRWLEP